jgi:signal peptidase II
MMKSKYLLLIAISGALITLDQVTKMYIHTSFRLGESTAVIHDFFNITYVRNYGAAFGFLANVNAAFREVFFLSIPPIALLIILRVLRGVPDSDRLQITSLSMIFGGAIGNYVDRLRFRFVIDFLDFHYKGIYSWPAFNIADSAIVCGVTILLLLTLRSKEPAKEEAKATS